MSEQFHRVYGILSAENIGGGISFSELHSVLHALELDDYYPSLQRVLNIQFSVALDAKMPIQIAIAALAADGFILSLPLRLSYRPTYINLLMLKSAILLYKKGLLTLKEIKMGAQGFFLAAKQMGCDNLPLEPQDINKAMRFADKTMSEKKIQAWIDKYFPLLYWKEDLSRDPGKLAASPEKCARIPRLYPHEFLYLICNAVPRLDYLRHMRLHKETNIKQEGLRRCLVPMQEVLIAPQCGTIDDEMQHALNLEYEQGKANMIFEGMDGKKAKELQQFMTSNSPGRAKDKTKRQALREERRLFTDEKTYNAIKLEIKHMSKRPVSSGPASNRQLISALKQTEIYTRLNRAQPMTLRRPVDRSMCVSRNSVRTFRTTRAKWDLTEESKRGNNTSATSVSLQISRARPRTCLRRRRYPQTEVVEERRNCFTNDKEKKEKMSQVQSERISVWQLCKVIDELQLQLSFQQEQCVKEQR